MRFNTTSLFVASTFFCMGSSLPFFAHRRALVPRATYSVVPVDGGSAASTNNAGQGEVTIVQTIVQTPLPATQTLIKTDTLPPTTEVIISTRTVEGPKTTQTIDVTITPTTAPVTITATEYSVINISGPTTIVLPPTTTPSQVPTEPPASSSKPASTSSTSTLESVLASRTKSSNTSTAPASTSTTFTFETSYISSVTQVSSLASITTTSYDDGQWHTTYPTWSNGTATLKTADTPVSTMLPVDTSVTTESNRSEFKEVLQFFRRFSIGYR